LSKCYKGLAADPRSWGIVGTAVLRKLTWLPFGLAVIRKLTPEALREKLGEMESLVRREGFVLYGAEGPR
jgi:hypothetical protein